MAGPDARRTIDLAAGRHFVGRARTCDVVIDDPSLEAHHVVVTIDPAAGGGFASCAVAQLTGRFAIEIGEAPGGAVVVGLGATRFEIGPASTRAAVPRSLRHETGTSATIGLALPTELDDAVDRTALPDLGNQGGVGSRPAGEPALVGLDVFDRRSGVDRGGRLRVIGIVDGSADRCQARAIMRSVVVDASTIRPSGRTVATAFAMDVALGIEDLFPSPIPGDETILFVTDRPGMVRGPKSPVPAWIAGGRDVTVLVAVERPDAPVLSAGHAVLELGPRWRARWTADTSQPADLIRVHAAGMSAPTARAVALAGRRSGSPRVPCAAGGGDGGAPARWHHPGDTGRSSLRR
jgi:hypothetical protein